MIRIYYLLFATLSLVLLNSCFISSQNDVYEGDSDDSIKHDTVFKHDTIFIIKHDTIYTKQDSIVSNNEEEYDDTKIISQAFEVGKFNSLEAGGLFEITFEESDHYSVLATGTKKQLNNLVCRTIKGTLQIYSKPTVSVGNGVSVVGNGNVIQSGVSGNVIISNGPVCIGGSNCIVNNTDGTTIIGNSAPIKLVIKGKLSERLDLSGSCTFRTKSIKVSGDFDIDASNSSKLKIEKLISRTLHIEGSNATHISIASASATNVVVDGSNSSQLNISSVTANNIDIDASNSCTITMTVECNNIGIEASNSSNCIISGRTKTIKTEKSNSGIINISNLQKS